MCEIIVINRGEKQIETPRQFEQHFGFLPKDILHDSIDMDCCLCQCDIEQEFNENNIPFKMILGDFYVGELDKVTDSV